MTGPHTSPNGQLFPPIGHVAEAGPIGQLAEAVGERRADRAAAQVAGAATTAAPDALRPHEIGRIRAAEHHARRVYPGPVGELLARELRAHAEFGYRFQAAGLLTRVAR